MALAMISVLMVPLSRSTFSKLCHAPPCLSDQFFHYTPRQEPDLIPRFPRTTRIWFNWVSHHCQNTKRPLEELREAKCILNFGKMWVICGQRVKSRHYCPFGWDKRHCVADHTVLKQDQRLNEAHNRHNMNHTGVSKSLDLKIVTGNENFI
jgi:hypothetical protein